MEINVLETRLEKLVKQEYQEQLTLLKSIPGIGVKTAMFLLLVTDGFNKFDNAFSIV